MKLHLWFLIRGQYNLGFINVEVISKFKKNGISKGKTLESPLDCNEIKSVNPKGNQS